MKGRPILGIISGFLFGLLLGVTLFLFGALSLDSPWLLILPVLGIALGLALAAWAPFGSGAPQTSAGSPAAPGGPSGTTLEQPAIPPVDEGGPGSPPAADDPSQAPRDGDDG